MRQHKAGFTIFELLIVVAIIGIVGGIAVFNARDFLQAEQTRGLATTLQEMFQQGSTAASARFKPVLLTQERQGTVRTLVLREQGANTSIRRDVVPQTVSTNLPVGTIATFLPSGRIDPASYQALPQQISITGKRLRIDFAVTLIGESKITAVRR